LDIQSSLERVMGELHDFHFEVSSHDKIWRMVFPGPKHKWHTLQVRFYDGTYYFIDVSGKGETLVVEPGKPVQLSGSDCHRFTPVQGDDRLVVWADILPAALRWMNMARRDWIKAARHIERECPLDYRYGVVPHAVVRAALPGIYRLDEAIGPKLSRAFNRLVEEGLHDTSYHPDVETMNARTYFEYCKIAYLAGREKVNKDDKKMSGRAMYKKFADYRYDGLLDLDPNSTSEFTDWVEGKHPKRTMTGKPWHIMPGGGRSTISLAVHRAQSEKQPGFKVVLTGESIHRLAATVKMFPALRDAGKPVSIMYPEDIRLRILALDNIGILPGYTWLAYGHHHFQHQHVYDVMYWSDFGRAKPKVRSFVRWEPLPVLRPVSG
jgi:hypothetical protein